MSDKIISTTTQYRQIHSSTGMFTVTGTYMYPQHCLTEKPSKPQCHTLSNTSRAHRDGDTVPKDVEERFRVIREHGGRQRSDTSPG